MKNNVGVLHMKKLVLALLLCSAWAVGIYSGDCTFAVVFSLVPLLQFIGWVCSLLRARG